MSLSSCGRKWFPLSNPALGALLQGPILVMDDEEMVLTLAAMMLKCLGYQATVCMNGDEALENYQKARAAGTPHLGVILDLTVYRGMGGRDVARQILLEDPDARLIVSCGNPYDPVLADHKTYGFCSTLAKPYRLSDLVTVLAGLFPWEDRTCAHSPPRKTESSSV